MKHEGIPKIKMHTRKKTHQYQNCGKKKSYLIQFYRALGEARLRARKNDLCDFSKKFALPRDHM